MEFKELDDGYTRIVDMFVAIKEKEEEVRPENDVEIKVREGRLEIYVNGSLEMWTNKAIV